MNDHGHIVIFDGVCNLCNGLVRFIIKRDKNGVFSFAALQTDAGRSLSGNFGLKVKNIDSVLYITDGKFYLKSSAVLHLLKDLGGPFKLFYAFIIIPAIIRDFFYDLIAKYRYSLFGRKEKCMIPSAEDKERFLA